MNPRVALTIKKEIENYLNISFIVPIDYSLCISNIMSTTNPICRIIRCIDFGDINKAYPKCAFPLPHIYMIVDLKIGHEIFYFMDGFSNYNKITINKQDQYKITFITPWGTFCWVVMPFGLKNVGTTYQKYMT